MGRFGPGVPLSLLCFMLLVCGGCGGGAQSFQPPPQPDFAFNLSATTVTVADGGTSAAVSVTVIPENGFGGAVQVTLANLPAGVSSNPASPFTVSTSAATAIYFGAAGNAAPGTFTVSAQGSSGALSHSANLSLAVQGAVLPAVPRTTFVRTDAVPALDSPFGEPHHTHLTYDSVNKQVFVANNALNRVEVFSSKTLVRTGAIAVPGASSADVSADGTMILVGTSLQQIVAIDPLRLQVAARYSFAGLSPLPNSAFDRPEEILTLVNGKALVRLKQAGSSLALLAEWDPSSKSLTNLTPNAPALFQNGVGVMARTGDHSRAIVAAGDASGLLALFDASGNVSAGPASLGSGQVTYVAADLSGARFAAIASGVGKVVLLDATLNPVSQYVSASAASLSFSRDGKTLYVAESAANGAAVVTALDSQTGNVLGQVTDAAIQGVPSIIETADENGMIFGLGNRGVSFVDASLPNVLPQTAPEFSALPFGEGPLAGGTVLTLAGQNFTAPAMVNFGAQSASNVTVSSSTQVQATAPATTGGGAVNATAYFKGGSLLIAPDAFSYGPEILSVTPNAGASSGNESLQIYGYGFGSDPAKLSVKIGASAGSVEKIENVAAILPSLQLDSSYPFPLQRVTLQTPAGSAGKADVVVSTTDGAATATRGFQYLQSELFYAQPALWKFILYDQKRQRLYLSNIDHVDVFDLGLATFLAPIEPPGGPPPDAGLRGLSMTPDASQLVIADFGAQSIYLMDPVAATGTKVAVGGIAGFQNSGPSRVAATSAQTVFVGLSAEGGTSGPCSACLDQMDLAATPPTIQPAPQPEVSTLVGAPLVQGTAAGDHVFLSFGAVSNGPLASWQASSPNQLTTSMMGASAKDLGVAADGTMFALQTNYGSEVHSADLFLAGVPTAAELAQIPGRMNVPGVTMHPTGALIYQPFLTGAAGSSGVKGGIDILDAHSGALRLRIFLPQQLMTDIDGMHGSFLCTDENGQRIFAITSKDGNPLNAGVTIVKLASVPLGIGTLSPTNAAIAGGSAITIRGSGLQATSKVLVGGKPAAVTFKDMNTLSIVTPALGAGAQQITITNADGESTSLDGAVIVN